MGLEQYQIIVGGLALSDLFFNFEHPERDKVYLNAARDKRPVDENELNRAMLIDANSFIDSLCPEMRGDRRHQLALDLLADFEARV